MVSIKRMANKRKRRLAILGLILFVALPPTYTGISQLVTFVQSEPVTGTVVALGIDTLPVRGGTRLVPRVEHKYEVDGLEYTGKWLRPSLVRFRSHEQADSVLRMYKVGQRLTVYAPVGTLGHSFIERRLDSTPYRQLLFIIVVGLVLVAVEWRTSAREAAVVDHAPTARS